jgi:ketosteroid isomerase-like protein
MSEADSTKVALAFFENLSGAGKGYHHQYHDLLVVRDGKIHEGREYLDTAHA